MSTEQRDTKTIAGKFAEALSCIADAACHLRDIDKQYLKLYPDSDADCPGFELRFWWKIEEAIKPLEDIQKGLEAVETHMPKEMTA